MKAYKNSSVNDSGTSVSTLSPMDLPKSQSNDYVLQPGTQQSVQVQNPAIWDYRTAKFGLKGEPLPVGAKGWSPGGIMDWAQGQPSGWKPDGTPDFGAGLLGWVKNMNYKIFTAEQNSFQKVRSFAGSDPFTSEIFPRVAAFGTGVVTAGTELMWGGLNLLALSAQLIEQTSGTVGYALMDAFRNRDAFNDPKYLEHTWGASRGYYSGLVQTFAAPAMKVVGGAIESKIAENAKLYNEGSPLYKEPGFSQIGMLAAMLVQQDSFGKTALDSVQLRNEFIQRMNAGERPDNIYMDMSIKGQINPWMEMAGQVIFDPLNLPTAMTWAGKGRRVTQEVTNAAEKFLVPESKAAADFMAQGAKALAATGDEAAAAKVVPALLEDVQSKARGAYNMMDAIAVPSPHIQGVDQAILDRAKIYAPMTPETRRSAILNSANMVIEEIARVTPDPVQYINEMEALADLSREGRVANDAVLTVLDNPAAHIALSPAGNDMGAFMRRMIDENPNLLKDIRQIGQSQGTAGVAAYLSEKGMKVADQMVPDAKKVLNALDKSIAYEKAVKTGASAEKMSLEEQRLAAIGRGMDAGELQAWRMHIAAQEGIVGKTNRFYSQLYMGASPGSYAIRNFTQNNFNMFADFGPRIWFSSGDERIRIANLIHGYSLPNIEGMNAGSTAANALEIIGKQTDTTTGVRDFLKAIVINPETGKPNRLFGFLPYDLRKGSSILEENAARNIVGTAYLDHYRGDLPKLVADLKNDVRFRGIPDAAWKSFQNELAQSGNIDKAMQSIYDAVTTGVTWDFKQYDNLPKTWRDAISAYGKETQWKENVLNAKSTEEAKAALAKMFDEIKAEKLNGLTEGYQLSLSNPDHVTQIMAAELGTTTDVTARLDAMMGDVMNDLRGRARALFKQLEDAKAALPTKEQLKLNDLAAKLEITPFSEANSATYLKNREVLRQVGFEGTYGQILEGVRAQLTDSEIMSQVINPRWQNDYRILGITDPKPNSWRQYADTVWTAQKAKASEEWRKFLTKELTNLQQYVDAVEKAGGVVDPQIKDIANSLVEAANYYDGIKIGYHGALVADGLPILKGESQVSIVSQIANYYGIQGADKHLLNIINQYSATSFTSLSKDTISMEQVSQAFAEKTKTTPLTFDELMVMFNKDPKRMAKFTTSADIANQKLAGGQLTPQEVKDLTTRQNPLSYLKSQGITINSNEFSDIMGGKFGVDKQGVAVGLFAKDGQGLDEVGRALADGGLITPEQGADLNYVRDYLRNANKVTPAEQQMLKAVVKPTDVPTVVYHATNRTFEGLPKDVAGFGGESRRMYGEPSGVFYSTTENAAKQATGFGEKQRIIPANVSSKNPLIVEKNSNVLLDMYEKAARKVGWNGEGSLEDWATNNMAYEDISRQLTKDLQAAGYDAVYNKNNGDFIALTEKAVNISPVKTSPTGNYRYKYENPNFAPSPDQIINNINEPMVRSALEKYIDDTFNKVTQVAKDANAQKTIDLLKPEAAARLGDLKLVSSQVAQEARNFTILNYGHRVYNDLASAYLMPYGFWYKGQLGTWAQRIVDSPAILAGYAKYKQAMAAQNAAAPSWMKQNIEINNVFGIPLKNPLFFNLEQSIWPLNGITGEDFTDPNRAANWWTYTLDGINQFGPNTWTPFNIAAGLILKAQGNQPASDAWLGRMSSASLLLKRMTGIETDPIVGLLQGGLSPAETSQVNKELAALVGITVAGHTITEAEVIDAAHSHSGPLWDIAVKNSNANHLTGQVMSSVFGIGLKPRTQSDMQIEQFYGEYGKLFTLYKGGFKTKDQFRQEMALLGEKYPFMDALLIGKKGGPERDTALAYNVLSRIPPGDATDLMKFVGMDNATVNRFYNDGGDISKWTPADQAMFNAAILQLAATFEMPNLPTKQEWNTAKTQYDEMRTVIAKQLGADIWTKMDTYYAAKDAGRGSDFLAANPDVQQAFDLKDSYVVNNPLLSTYYGGIDTIQRYYEGQARTVLEKKYGQNIYQLASQYYSANDTAEKKSILKQNPQLKPFMDEKALWTKWVVDATVKMGARLQDKPALALRPATSSTIQTSLGEFQNQRKPSAAEWQQLLGAPMFNLIVDSQNGRPLSYTAQKNLDYEARRLGYYDGNALLTDVLVSIQQP